MSELAITGLNSNLDTNAIIEALLTMDNKNVTLLQYDQTVKTNQISTFQSISAKLLAFQTKASFLSKDGAYEATKIDISDEDYVTAAAGKNVGFGTYIINIDALAQNHQIASQGFSEVEKNELGTGTITLQVGDFSSIDITIDSSNNTMEGIRDAINASKSDVSASIVNDGSSGNQYRLLLTSDKTGQANEIKSTFDLSGSKQFDFENSSFDNIEKLSYSDIATSSPTLGTTALYTGNENKTYSFTIAGNGTQTVGAGDITINWSDGTNSGSIIVSSADTEVFLSGTGSDGLTLQFSAGDIVAGDTFQIQTFTPTLQLAQDAKISLGSTSGGGSPITVTSENNMVTDLIPGVTLNLKKITDQGPITITAEQDSDKITNSIQDFISTFNDIMDSLDKQFTYDPENPNDAGVLFSDSTLVAVQTALRTSVISPVNGLETELNMLSSIGIRIGATGRIAIVDYSKFNDAIDDNLSDVKRLFAASGTSTNSQIEFLTINDKTKILDKSFDVNITKIASKGLLRGKMINDPSVNPLVIDSSNKNLVIRVNGMQSETITLTEGSYISFQELVDELQQKIDDDEKIGKMGAVVEYFDSGNDGYLTITSNSYGKNSKVEIGAGVIDSAFLSLGLANATSVHGSNVEGTINGELATGVGNILTGNKGNSYTEGLRLKINMTENDLHDGSEGTINITKGVGSRMYDLVETYTRASEGLLEVKTKTLKAQISDIEKQVDSMNVRIELKRQRLLTEFLDLESILGRLNAQSDYLTSQLNSLNSNWNFNKGN